MWFSFKISSTTSGAGNIWKLRLETHFNVEQCEGLPNSPGNSCCASSTRRSVHQRSCDDPAEPSGDVFPDAECCESRMALFDLLPCVIFEFQSDCGGELGKWWYTAVGPVGRCICDGLYGAILTIYTVQIHLKKLFLFQLVLWIVLISNWPNSNANQYQKLVFHDGKLKSSDLPLWENQFSIEFFQTLGCAAMTL